MFILYTRLLTLFNQRGECYCTDDPGMPDDDSECRYNCLGDPTTICGGERNTIQYNSVYGTGRLGLYLSKVKYLGPKGSDICFCHKKL